MLSQKIFWLLILSLNSKSSKLCNFGLIKIKFIGSQLCSTMDGMLCPVGTWQYMAPEVLTGSDHPSELSYIWSFAVTVVELYSAYYIQDPMDVKNKMKEFYKKKVIPSLTSLPTLLKPIIKEFFNFDSGLRFTAQDI